MAQVVKAPKGQGSFTGCFLLIIWAAPVTTGGVSLPALAVPQLSPMSTTTGIRTAIPPPTRGLARPSDSVTDSSK